MSFVRKKTVRGQQYHYLCESRWEDGKPRQRVIAYLGRFATVRGAHAYWVRESKKTGRKTLAQGMIRKLKRYL